MVLQVNQAVNQAISSAVPLPAAIAIPMSTDIGINAKTMDGEQNQKPAAIHQKEAIEALPTDSSAGMMSHAQALRTNAALLRLVSQPGLPLLTCPQSRAVIQSSAGTTPLMAAVKAGKPEAVAELLAAGADARRGDSSGATAVHHAAWQGQAACLAVLLQHGQQQEEQEAAGGSWVPR